MPRSRWSLAASCSAPGTRELTGNSPGHGAAGGQLRQAASRTVVSGLAARAPVGDPLAGVAALFSGPDRGSATAAGTPRTPVHPGLLAPPQAAGGDLAGPLLVRLQQPLGGAGQGTEVGHRAGRPPRVDPVQEQRFRLVDVADAGQVALVEQGLTDRPGRLAGQPAGGL